MKISPNFTLEEFTFSQTAVRAGIDNSLPPSLMPNLVRLADTMELVRSILGNRPIRVSSGYRCQELNKAIGGAVASAHMEALACDFTCPSFGTIHHTAETIASILEHFDQLIYEGTWVHIGLSTGYGRRELLTATFPHGKAIYQKGLVNA